MSGYMSPQEMLRMIDEVKNPHHYITCGQHKGKHYQEVDMDYLLWFVFNAKNTTEELKRNIMTYLIDNYVFNFGKFKGCTIPQILQYDTTDSEGFKWAGSGDDYLDWYFQYGRNINLCNLIGAALGKTIKRLA